MGMARKRGVLGKGGWHFFLDGGKASVYKMSEAITCIHLETNVDYLTISSFSMNRSNLSD